MPFPVTQAQADDATLVQQALRGNERAFATLYHRYARYVAGVAYRIMGRDSEVDDVVQEAFTDAALALATLRDPAGFRPWLVSITVRRVHRRLSWRRRFRALIGAAEATAVTLSDPADREPVDALRAALEELPLRLRTPWVLHVVEGETLPDVARICDVSLATVKRRIADAEERLGKKLGAGG